MFIDTFTNKFTNTFTDKFTNTTTTAIVIIIVIIIVMILTITVIIFVTPEGLTKIRRGVGVDPGGDMPVASGIVVSYPDLDFTHTWSDENLSCDECPNKYVCPECPNMITDESFIEINADRIYEPEFYKSRELIGAGGGVKTGSSKIFDPIEETNNEIVNIRKLCTPAKMPINRYCGFSNQIAQNCECCGDCRDTKQLAILYENIY